MPPAFLQRNLGKESRQLGGGFAAAGRCGNGRQCIRADSGRLPEGRCVLRPPPERVYGGRGLAHGDPVGVLARRGARGSLVPAI